MADKLRKFKNLQKSKFRRKKCPKCSTIFPLSKGINILSDNTKYVYCSLNCIPQKGIEILNCSVCSNVVENDSIFCYICCRWVHQQCSRLTDDDLNILQGDDNNWICFPCKTSIFPCVAQSTAPSIQIADEAPFKPPIWFKNKKCIHCNSSKMQKDCLSAYYKNRIVFFCSFKCTYKYNIEFLDCNECGKYVKSGKKVSSICCDTCDTWIHKNAVGLAKHNLIY